MTTKNLQIAPRGEREIVMERVFDAPRTLVYEAYTTPALVKRWLGVFGGWELAVCDMDVREGGTYRWVWRNRDTGAEMGAGGVFREVSPPDRLVCTEKFDDPWYAGEAHNTVTFVEANGKTTMTSTLRYESTEVRDTVLKSPMETGVEKSYDRLAEVLATGRVV